MGKVLPTLILRCQEGEAEAYVFTDMAPGVESGNLDGAMVWLRFDTEPAQTQNTGQSTSNDSLFFEKPRTLINTMLEHDQLIFGFTPFNASPVEMTFDLRGLDKAIAPLLESCPK